MSSVSRIPAFSLFFLSCMLAGAAGVSVDGSVLDSSGTAVGHATVILHQRSGSVVIRTESDASGRFSFKDVALAEYVLDASAPGLSIDEPEQVDLTGGHIPDLTLHLVVSAVKASVTVTAAAEAQGTDEVSKALDVVNAADAERRGLFSIGDAIRFVPGLRVSTRGGPGTFTTIQTRGLRVNDTAVLIDGFRFRDPTGVQGDASAFLGDLMLVDASRIEVVRGSGSSLYGTNSMSGTVNLITNIGGGPVHGDMDLQGGGLGLFRGLARVEGGLFNDRLNYSAGLSHLNVTDGVDSAAAVRDWSGQAGLGYAATPRIRLAANVFANTGFLQENVSPAPNVFGPGIIPAIPLSDAAVRAANAGLPYADGNATFTPSLGDPDAGRYSHFVNALFRMDDMVSPRLSYRLAYGILDTERNNTDGPAGAGFFQPAFNTSGKYLGRIDTAQGRINYRLGSYQTMAAGYEFEREHYRSVSTDQNPVVSARGYSATEARQDSQAVFAQDDIHLLQDRLEVLLSARFTTANLQAPVVIGALSPYRNGLPSPPNAYTGDASAAYFVRTTSTKLRAHTGNSFRLPSLYERFGGYLFGGMDFAYGDPRLSPERAISFDFGFDQLLFRDRLKVSSTYFYSRLQSVIGFLSFPPGYVDPFGRTSGYYNTKGGIGRGVELSGEFHPARSSAIFASYTYTNALDRSSQYFTGTAASPLQSPRILPHTVTVIATEQIGKKVDLGLDFSGGSDYLYPLYGYAYRFAGPRQLGLSAGYSFRMGERLATRLYVRASNVLDQDYYEDGFRTPRRWLVTGLHFSF